MKGKTTMYLASSVQARGRAGKRLLRTAAAGGLAAILGISSGAVATSPASAASLQRAKVGKPEVTTIKYQQFPGSVNALELAQQLGYIKPLTLDSVGVVTGGPASAQAIATGHSDIGHIGNSAFLNLLAAGAKVKAVLSEGGFTKSTADAWYVLKSSKIHSAKDLIGKKAAVNTLGAIAQGEVDTYLLNAKLSEAQIKKVTLAVLPDTDYVEALETGKVDVASLSPVEAKALKGKVRELFNTYSEYGPIDDDVWIMSNSFLQNDPNSAHILVSGMAKATLWMQTHSVKQVKKTYEAYLTAHNRKEEIQDVESSYTGSALNDRAGVIKPKDFTYWIKWLQKQGELNGWDKPLSDVYTNAFNSYAAK